MCVSSAEYTEDYIYVTRGEYRYLWLQPQCLCLKAGKDSCVHVMFADQGYQTSGVYTAAEPPTNQVTYLSSDNRTTALILFQVIIFYLGGPSRSHSETRRSRKIKRNQTTRSLSWSDISYYEVKVIVGVISKWWWTAIITCQDVGFNLNLDWVDGRRLRT